MPPATTVALANTSFIDDVRLPPLKDEDVCLEGKVITPLSSTSDPAGLSNSGAIMLSECSSEDSNSATARRDEGITRWIALLLTCLLLFGTDYCYDLPGAIGAGDGITIQTHFARNGETYNQKMNQALFAVYSYPNMVMTILGGLLIDKYLGLRRATILFCGCVVLATFSFAVGVATTSYSMMVAARFLFGCSAESLCVSQNSFVSRWFGGSKFQAFAFGISISFSRLGGALVYLLSPLVAKAFGAPASAFAGFSIAFISFCAALGLVWIDYASERRGVIPPQGGGGRGHGHSTTDAKELEDGKSTSTSTEAAPKQPFKLSYFRTLPSTLWLMAIACGLCYGSAFPFVAIAKTYFERTYSMDGETASYDTSLFHLMGAMLCPLIGLAVDRIGRGPIWLGMSTTGLACLYSFLFAFPGRLNAIALMMVLSSLYATFVAGLWSFVNFTSPGAASGFAFGIVIAGCNFALATNPLVIGTVLDAFTDSAEANGSKDVGVDADLLPSEQGFSYVLAFLVFTSLLGLANAIALWSVDKANKGILMAPPTVRGALKEALDEEVLAKWKKLDEAERHTNDASENATSHA